MGFPVSYFDSCGRPMELAAGAQEAYDRAVKAADRAIEQCLGADAVVQAAIAAMRATTEGGPDMVVTLVADPYPGQVARVRIDAYGESAAEVEATLLEMAKRCDAATQASECSYGECVIERNLEEQWGATYSWRGRILLHSTIGTAPGAERAAAAVE